ncbi:MAG: hypothetical protein Q9160_003054 [Pyrenula sp. 1 TL-2023]
MPARYSDDEDSDPLITEVESYCTVCEENGVTRLRLVRIPYFREILVESFSCDCGNRNSSTRFAGEIQELGCKYTFKVEHPNDLMRQVIRSESAAFKVEDLDIEMPSGRGAISNVEGMICKIIDDLEMDQPSRKIETPRLHDTLEGMIEKLVSMQRSKTFPFTISLDDPAGNSVIQPSTLDPRGKYIRQEYPRTHEQNVKLGITSNDAEGAEAITHDLEDLEIVENQPYSLQENCPSCSRDCQVNISKTNIPHFKEVFIIATVCEHCGYRTNDVKTGGEIPEKGVRISITVEKVEDLSRDLLKSESCAMKCSELGLEVHPGTLGGRFTTVEGLLSQVRDQLYGQIFDAGFDEVAVKDGSVNGGDSMASGVKEQWLEFFKKLEQARKAEIKYTIVLEDPLAGSYVQSLRDDGADPQIQSEEYERTEDEIEELGLKDMKTEGYEDDEDKSEGTPGADGDDETE